MPDSALFVLETERFRRELLAHCYRMLGSIHDAEDLVQETYLRAWRSYGGFEGRSSVRTWLYQIATNGCLTELAKRSRRMLPSGLYDPEPDPCAYPEEAGTEVNWLQPAPDAMVTPDSADPAVIIAAREGLRLALIASLQYLPPRQRAILVLRDVLAFPATEVAVMLGTTTVSVKSALQRARARLRDLAPTAGHITEPTAPRARALLDQYITAFENAGAAALERLLIDDATLEATPSWSRCSGSGRMRPELLDGQGVVSDSFPFWPGLWVLPRPLPGITEKNRSNLFGTFAVTQALLPALTRTRGAIVDILSVNALAPLPFIIPAYSVSKAAAFSLTQSLRARVAGQGVRVHAVLPGPVDTDMTRGSDVPKASPESVALAIFDAVDNGEEEIFPDPVSAPMAAHWRDSAAKVLERQLAHVAPVSSPVNREADVRPMLAGSADASRLASAADSAVPQDR